MPKYTEVSAHIPDESGRLIPAPTKKALKEAVKANPSAVRFRDVGGLNASFHGSVEDLPAHATLTVVGPDPFRNRKWYASVKQGKVT